MNKIRAVKNGVHSPTSEGEKNMNLDPEAAESSGSCPGVVSPAAGRVPGGERGDVCARLLV